MLKKNLKRSLNILKKNKAVEVITNLWNWREKNKKMWDMG